MSKTSITLEPIDIPLMPSEEWMAPYRKLATAVIVHAVKDLIPTRAKNNGPSDKERMIRERTAAEMFLRGESAGGVDLDLWCSVVGVDTGFVKQAMSGDGGRKMFKFSRELAAQNGRSKSR